MRKSMKQLVGKLAGGFVMLTGLSLSGQTIEPIAFNPVGIPYAWGINLPIGSQVQTSPDHVGAWSWDEDGFPSTARGWTHTSKWIKLELPQATLLTLTLSNLANVPWPTPSDTNRMAGTNLYPSFTLYRGWDTDEGTKFDTNGATIDQEHTFNNRGNIEWAEDVIYLDHLENAASHLAERSWIVPAGQYTINLGGNSPATIAEGRQGYQAVLRAAAPPVSISNAVLTSYPFNPVGIPYGAGLVMSSESTAETIPDHVGAWSWDEDGFPGTARGWTHTSKWLKMLLLEPAEFSLTLSNLANVPWPSGGDPGRLAGTNLYPSFTLYRGWDTDVGVRFDTNGVSIDQSHTFNNRGDVDWAEDATYLDHFENTNSHSVTRKWFLPAGSYSINLGGNSPATIAEGRQGYKALFVTKPASVGISNALSRIVPFNPIGIPYGLAIVMDDSAIVQTVPDHVGAWSWDEDGFPTSAKGWTHTSKWLQLALTKPARLTLLLESLAGVSWPSGGDPNRLAGTNLYPSFTLYRGWDTDAGENVDTNGVSIDQEHTFNNRGNIAWAEDVVYVDHLENSSQHSATRSWVLPAGNYTINLGGNSPETLAEGRQGFLATLSTEPAAMLETMKSAGTMRVRWSAKNDAFGLFAAPALSGPWNLVGTNSVQEHGWQTHPITIGGDNRFFRLEK